jgi:predicted ATPase/DNA-binding CsgD family transcriptional regulator
MAPPGVREDGIDPLPPPTPNSQRLRAVVSAEAATAPRAPGLPPNNLPLELSSFVGRQDEVAEVGRLLENNRLLTLTGPGGCGKTRLALAAAGDVARLFGDGVWLAELAPVADPALVGRMVASALGARGRPGRPTVETLSEHLGTSKVLLVLDNCEHLIGACAEIAESLLRSCPGLRVLATSREALGVVGEVARPVPPLSLPDLRRLPDVGGLAVYGAARLFVERAAAVSPTFRLTERNAPSVARVCYRLDGIPLAIELAAARTKVLTVEEISARLDDCFELLVAGGRTAMPRHKTLHATMDWSHDLLSGPERALFRRLSVFADGFSLDAAESVCAEEDLGQGGVLGLLSHLVDKSLVIAREAGGGARYRLLETIRQYGQGKLCGSADEAEVRRRHAAFFVGLAERTEPKLSGPEQVGRLDELERENGNFRVVMGWALAGGEAGMVARLGWALRRFWLLHGHQGEGRRWMEALLERDVPPGPRSRAALVAALMSHAQRDYEACEGYAPEALTLSRRVGDEPCAAYALTLLGLAQMRRGDVEGAKARFEGSLPLLRRSGEEQTVPLVLVWLGNVALVAGDRGRATRLFEEALALARQRGDGLGTNIALYNLAQVALSEADLSPAAAMLEEGLASSRQMGDQANLSYFLEGLAVVAGARGESRRAALMLGAAQGSMDEAGAPVYNYYMPDRSLYDRTLAAARSRLGEEAFAGAWAEGRAMASEVAVEHALGHEAGPEPASPEVAVEAHPAGLSDREVEVLRLVASGMTNAEVAGRLFLSPRTVDWHVSSIYRKLGLHSRAEAARFAAEQGLL